MKWKFLNTGRSRGSFNMEFDLKLAQLFTSEDLSVLRLYGWQPAAISVGYNQSFDEFDQEKLERSGIDLVRRPTGGRAILHDEELTYSVVMSIGDRSLRDIYRLINEGLLSGVRNLGIDARFSDTGDNFQKEYRQASGIPCFATSAKCEIHVEGKKIIGSAQRKFGNVVLQHGSFLLGPSHVRITEFLSKDVSAQTTTIAGTLQSHAVDAESILGKAVSFDEAAESIKAGFEDVCSAEWIESEYESLAFPVTQ